MNPITIKRIKTELAQYSKNPDPWFRTFVDQRNLANVHFTFLGPPHSEFEGGLYHGVILLPDEYPMKPPNIQFYNDSGRFEVKVNICTTFTQYHEDEWMPSWNIRNIILGLRSMFTDESPNAIGSMASDKSTRIQYAKQSKTFVCKECGCNHAELQLTDEEIKNPEEDTPPAELPKEDAPTPKLPDSTIPKHQKLNKYIN